MSNLTSNIFVAAAIRQARNFLVATGLAKRKYEDEFTKIFASRYWASEESVSGGGSTLEATSRLRAILPAILKEKKISSLLDVPCGDFNWMQSVPLEGISYIGGDIVPELVAANNKSHARENVRFVSLDVINEPLPRADMVICRDCLVHLPLTDGRKALRNIAGSGATWLLTTTFTSRSHNADIAPGKWRPLNLQAPPFSLPEPEALFNEECSEADGKYADKSLGLWRCDVIRKAVG